MIELRQTWKRILIFWTRFLSFWPRLIFLITFFLASASVAFSVVVWIQCPRCKHSWNGTPNQTSLSVGNSETPASVPGASAPPSSSSTSSVEAPARDEPNQTIQTTPSPLPTIASSTGFIIPVQGIKATQLTDTFNEARSEGRSHNAIDIMAPRGAAVLAATNGKIVKLLTSERGGITIYQLSTDEKLIMYYAHLEKYAEGLAEGRSLRQGEKIGYVGDTGNAGAGNYHLHFALWNVTDPKRYWDGVDINPYPLLRGSQ